MQDKDLLKYFNQKCIDNMPHEDLIRSGLNTIPAILIISNDTKKIYEGKAAFEWISNLIKSKTDNMSATGGICKYDPTDAQGISDTYAYWTNDVTKDINIAQPKNFQPYGKDEQYKIVTPIDNSKVSMSEQQKKMYSISNERSQQDTQIRDTIKQQLETNFKRR